MSDIMNAAFFNEYGGHDTIEIGELNKPEPGEGEVLVRIKAAGVNPVDAAIVQGMLKDAIPAEFPAIPGWDLAGVVEGRGHAARRFQEGDEVYAYARRPVVQHGTFAEYVVLPESYLSAKPSNLSMEEAAGIPLVGLTAYQSIFDAARLKKGDTLLILGASGGVGTLAIQLAKAKGAIVIGVASEKNHSYMKDLGADHTLTYEDTHVGNAVRELAPEGVDVVFHCSRGDALDQCLEAGILKEDGFLVSITKSQPDIPDSMNFQYVFVEPNARQLDHIRELAEEGHINIPVTKSYALEDTPKALEQIGSLHTRGKIVITP